MTSLILSKPADHAPEKFFSLEQRAIIKNTLCKDLSNDDFAVFLYACARTGLDPFMRQIYAVPRFDGGQKKMTIQTGIDGYRLIAERTKCYAPGKPTEFTYDKEGHLFSATSYVKKLTADRTWHEVSATAMFCEYAQYKKDGGLSKFWQQMGHTMIAKCAEALALRKAFPAELAGVYTAEEMQQAEKSANDPNELPVTVAEEITAELQQNKQKVLEDEGKLVAEFVDDWNGDKADIKEFLKAAQKHYGTLSMAQIVEELKKDPASTCKRFDVWSMKKAEKQARAA